MTSPDTVIRIAGEQIGYLEKSKSAYQNDPNVLYSKTDGAGRDNYTIYGYEMHKIYPSVMDFPASWCDSFADWCFYKAYGIATAKSLIGGNFNDYTVASAEMYKQKNAWHTTEPLPGDQVFFRNEKRICHTGIVFKVDKHYIYTIEGNTSSSKGVVANGGCVARKQYAKTYARIAGYGRPKYDIRATTALGDVNANVTYLQQRLISKGYYLGRYGADGDFGSFTFNAVKAFQAQNGLRVTGSCNAETWKKLIGA